jgi:kynurenine formamidase
VTGRVETVGTDAGGAAASIPRSVATSRGGECGLMQLATWRSSRRPGAVVVVAPLKLVDGTGTPTRVLALV